MPLAAPQPSASPHVEDPPLAFHFALAFDARSGMADVAFQKASGLESEIETDAYREGGENRFVHALPKSSKHPKLTLERGIAALDSGLVLWCKRVLEGGFAQRIVPVPVQVHLRDRDGSVLRSWTLDRAWPVKWRVGEFSSTKNEVAIETIELAYSTLVRSQ